ncbi:aminotransferase class V-fold PLP-dependent enzyme [Moraxella haemolytica]|uniref:aminotransferase class V-fold PLP-dependent enzyme n=1 Tax=Moraxella haemolytica TaxID=2904119 RepID=UPI002542C53C|nr:aminotransferase class V-fold PLP-dependent enzyme [Moraxella sp. ZY171148]WII94891.1 aminotransferase class V-fold PLP-dependent enzyme [Moraxella sp. ZY171148]
MYNPESIRQEFLAFNCLNEHGQSPIFFDGPGGSQVPKMVTGAMSEYLGKYHSNMGGLADAGRRTTAINDKARQMAGLWLGCEPQQVVFGLNATSLMFQFSRVLARTWQAGDNIVVSQIDHFSNVSSWQSVAEEKGLQVRRIPLNADGSSLDLTNIQSLIDEQTRLVAVSLASNVIGTRTEIGPIISRAKAVNAYVAIDAVHAIVHEKINATQLDCDLLFASSYKLGGARLGMAYASKRVLDLPPYKVEPATHIRPFAFEQGTQSFEAQAGFIALMQYWANLGGQDGDMDKRLMRAYQVVQSYEYSLSQAFLAFVNERSYIQLYGKNSSNHRTPTFAFNLIKDGQIIPPANVSKWLGDRNVALPSGNFYALDVVRHLDLVACGFLRVGFLHYTTHKEIARLFELLDEYVAQF